MKKCGVRITIIGLCGRGGFVPQPKPAQNVNAAQLRQCVLGAGHEILYVVKRL